MKNLLRAVIFFGSLFLAQISLSQNYTADWESLDKRPLPEWYKDAKFGIFIHWGVYSVPGYSKVGDYAEWYQNGLMNGDSARIKYHKAKFGDRTYYDLAKDFKAELFNPDDWAKLIEKSGAKYIVLTSKHHDGFCLWPNKTANQTWGFDWNAMDVGPHRDLLGDLFTAVRKTSVHAGMYFSLYEWFNPLWKSDPKKYATQHVWPQMKELINTYQPDVFWTDGDWDASAATWKSQEFLAWLYNESPVKNNVVTYDRWGSGVRFNHGGVYTPEYQPDLDFEDHYWEESRGMGYSYGYNRAEDATDYNSTQSLVLQLVDKVSRGGNFLLDIGPDEHGKIPPIMQERLLQIGNWMDINSEAIYNTTRWKTSSQWSEGRQDYKSKSGDMLLKITLDPDPGYAVKEVFYTYNPTTNSLYAILPKYPENNQVILKGIQLQEGAAVSFLATKENVKAEKEGSNTVIHLPPYNPNKIKAPYAYVLKIANYGKFAAKPEFHLSYKNGGTQPTISFVTHANEQIRFTTNGTEPTEEATLYTQPLSFAKTTLIKARTFASDKLPGVSVSHQVDVYQFQKATNKKDLKKGIAYKYYEPSGKINLASVQNSPVVKEGVTTQISEAVKKREEKYALQFNGYIKIPEDGVYSFYTLSDDGSKLYVDEVETVNNDGEHGALEVSGKAALRKGFHKIRVVYFDGGGGNELKVKWQKPGGQKEPIPATILFH